MSRFHIALIPDGNRRWAKAGGFLPWKGHEYAAKNFSKLVEWAAEDGRTAVLTMWCFSTENWKRSPEEVNQLMKILRKYLTNERANLQKNRIHLIRSGRDDRLEPELLKMIEEIGEETKENPKMMLHLAIDYGGKDEVLRAIQKMEPGTIATDESVRAHLDHPELPDMDLIIRTSGEQRTSNFALWQSTYAEWAFIEKLFPDFTSEDLNAAIDAFEGRQRRFGA